MKILIVEDEKELAKILQEELERRGYEAVVSPDGETALTMLKSLSPEVIVLNLLLPKMDGFELLSVLQADRALRSIPVIVISNLGSDTDIKRALALGATDYFVKTEHPLADIVEKIVQLLPNKGILGES